MREALYIFLALLLTGFTQEPQQLTEYDQIKKAVEERRIQFQNDYLNADSSARVILADQASEYLLSVITEKMFPEWYGTPWDFNGTTVVPKTGRIACGYFVTTVLKHAAFRIPRIKWAQLASEGVILKMCKDVRRFRNSPVEEVESYVKNKPDGLYVVGLDSHVGFVCKKGKWVRFIHSNYYQSDIGVMAEELSGQNPFNDSSYRVLGRLFDREMSRQWILAAEWK